VDLAQQRIHRQLRNGTWDAAPVSTSRFGTGGDPGSNKTPTGWHQVREVIGIGGSIEQEYISREPVSPSDRDDRILSRILWLDGMDIGSNDTSHDRYIYIHGTNHVNALGTPASMGCVRMNPSTIAEWVDQLDGERPVVWIGELLVS
jgi:lipoprotein-anchoring transpeptidase ErfK/SrfK